MQFTMVSDAPLDSSGALLAISVENRGESAMATMLHTNTKIISTIADLASSSRGETRQHIHDSSKAVVAVFFTPKYCESIPLTAHAILPAAIIRNERKGTLRLAPG